MSPLALISAVPIRYLDSLNAAGCVSQESSIETRAQDPPEQLIERLQAAINKAHAEIPSRPVIRGIGIGAPNANYYRGTVEYPPNLNWKGVIDVVGLVKKYFDLPVAITNDANAAALGEGMFGAAKGMKDYIVITLGTGVGSGLVANGQLIYGADGFAGELGHVIVDPDGRWCGCGRRGCLEAYASAGGICRTAFEVLAESRDDSALRHVAFDELTAKKIADAALRGRLGGARGLRPHGPDSGPEARGCRDAHESGSDHPVRRTGECRET